MKKVLFRADSSSQIGLGHIKRDLVYASRLKDSEISFATRELNGNINNEVPYPIYNLQTNNCDELIILCNKLQINHLIIDNYSISFDDEVKIKEACNLELSVFDDTYEKHYCDEILNHNIGAVSDRYKGLIPPFTKVSLIEPLIREEFRLVKLRNRTIKNNRIDNIFICMGGTDTGNLSEKVLDTCQKIDKFNIHIVTTSSNKNIHTLKTNTKDMNNVSIHVDTDKIAELMNESDIGIITPSVIVHEAIFMKLPFIAIKTSSDQQEVYKYLKTNDISVMDRFDCDTLSILLLKELGRL